MDKREIYTKLFADSFIDDPGIRLQLEGLKNPEEAFKANCHGEIEAFDKLGLISTVGNDGILIGYTSEELQTDEFIGALQQASQYLLETVNEDELAIIQNNMLKLSEIVNGDWYRKFLGEKPVYNIHVVMVRKEMRGKGLLRKLFTPVFERCYDENRPIVLQTHSEDTASIYRHFGFELAETLHSEELDICCYNMLKRF